MDRSTSASSAEHTHPPVIRFNVRDFMKGSNSSSSSATIQYGHQAYPPSSSSPSAPWDRKTINNMVRKAHRDAVLHQLTLEEMAQCPSCVMLKFSMDESTGTWLWDTLAAARNTLQLQEGLAKKDGESAPPASGSNQVDKWQLTTTIRQIHVSTWTAACLVGMIAIAGSFIVERINDEVRIGYWKSSSTSSETLRSPTVSMANMANTVSRHQGTGKMTAMVLCFVYAALAWTMSNGLILNPRVLPSRPGTGASL